MNNECIVKWDRCSLRHKCRIEERQYVTSAFVQEALDSLLAAQAPVTKIAPCARLRTSSAPHVSDSPSAKSVKTAPRTTALTSSCSASMSARP